MNMKMNPLSKSFYFFLWESGCNTLHEWRMKAKALPAGVLLKYLMMLTLASLLPSSDHGLNCEEACCSEKEKREMRFFSFPFLEPKKIKSTVSRPEHSWSEVKVAQSCPILCNLMDYGILQGRILEWVAYPFSSGSSQPRKWTGVSCIAGGSTREALIEIPWSLNRERCEHS